MLGSAVVILILSAVAACGAALATNAWDGAERTANFWRSTLGSSALWYGRPVYYRWTGGAFALLGAGALIA